MIERMVIKPNATFNQSFGFESWRSKIWGSSTLKNLGCSILFTLNCNDIYAEDENLLLLKKEIELIKDNIIDISRECELEINVIEFRLNNALKAIKIALENKDCGVYIG